jgi:pimeloyl-ACP methyl ester carboxylesterase
VIIGHDTGASTAANCAILHPDIFRAVVQLSVPYTARVKDAVRPSEANRRRVKTRRAVLHHDSNQRILTTSRPSFPEPASEGL